MEVFHPRNAWRIYKRRGLEVPDLPEITTSVAPEPLLVDLRRALTQKLIKDYGAAGQLIAIFLSELKKEKQRDSKKKLGDFQLELYPTDMK